jgi:hypothetical protein
MNNTSAAQTTIPSTPEYQALARVRATETPDERLARRAGIRTSAAAGRDRDRARESAGQWG